MTARRKSGVRTNVQRFRERMRQRGFRLLQVWVPDTRSPAFARECRRQSLLVANDQGERAIMQELEPAQDASGWKA